MIARYETIEVNGSKVELTFIPGTGNCVEVHFNGRRHMAYSRVHAVEIAAELTAT